MPVRGRYTFASDTVQGLRVGRINAGINTTFIVYRIGDTVIDTGPSNQWREVQPFIEQSPVRQLLITHHHEDHSGNAAHIAALTNVIPLAPALGQAKLAAGYPTPLLQKIIWGSPQPVKTLPLTDDLTLSDGSPIVPVHTPGHARDLTVFFLPKQKWLFSGDLYVSRTLKVMRSDENLGLLMDSLRKVLALDFEVLLCPHRGIVEQGHAALQEKLENLERFCTRVQSLAAQGRTAQQITREVLGKEDMMAYITCYNFSRRNLVKEALKVRLPVSAV